VGCDAALMSQSNFALIDERQCVRHKPARGKARDPKSSVDRSVVQFSHAEVLMRQVCDRTGLWRGSELAARGMPDEILAPDDSFAA
jgi:hypothetical protein